MFSSDERNEREGVGKEKINLTISLPPHWKCANTAVITREQFVFISSRIEQPPAIFNCILLSFVTG